MTNINDTHYIIGSAIGSYPYPTIVRDFQSVIGKESRQQILKQAGRLPDYVVACVGGGSNAIGIFHPFMKDAENGDVKFVGVEAGGKGEVRSLEQQQHGSIICVSPKILVWDDMC